jgi:hypothetical protein
MTTPKTPLILSPLSLPPAKRHAGSSSREGILLSQVGDIAQELRARHTAIGMRFANLSERGSQLPSRDTTESNDDHSVRGPFYTVQCCLTECALSDTAETQLVLPILAHTGLFEFAEGGHPCLDEHN